MRKYLSYILLVLLVPILFLTGCGSSEPTKITLTKDNYSEYIGFNITYGDVYFQDDAMYCIAEISTFSKKENVEFDNCTINIKPTYSVSDGWIVNNQDNVIDTSISISGDSESSICLVKFLTPNEDYYTPTSSQSNIIVESITGQVIVK